MDLSAWSKDRWGLDMVLDNDARMATVGEWQYGAGRGYNDVVVITLGTGIGTGVVVDGALLSSKRNRAGSLGGHIPLSVESDIVCSCGNRACAEALASTWALRRDVSSGALAGQLAESDPSEIGFPDLYRAVDAGDSDAVREAERIVRVWATLTVALIHAYDPDIVIFTGNVARSAGRILPGVRKYVDQYAWTLGFDVAVEQGNLPGTAGLLGAGSAAAAAAGAE